MKRRTAREKALQALFQVEVSQIDPKEALEHVLEDKKSDDFLEELLFGTIEHKEDIDSFISLNLENWKLERLGNVDRVILSLAAFELKYMEDIPSNVSIDEAIELAKMFGDDDSSKFINAVLSKMKKQIS
ncbi:transcription antitermination factor NusB [Bacillus solimangrovi]|uniref:Transcription antitermination protein NusB n=1 Tax=Bacillus solimangrovi TaxID=1305675 RepID=A0A1E5LK78_9BACI|nr:transcription antitermination factor NusB [Bacillus solimangrovi]OEH94490.1 transcription antitermination factor NusB [Bacillus solimangrovi]